MENSSGSSNNCPEISNSMSSAAASGCSGSAVNDLSLSVGNLSLTERRTDTINHQVLSPGNYLLPDNGSNLPRIEETRTNNALPWYQAGFPNSMPVPPPLFSETIWASNSLGINGQRFQGERLQPGKRSFVPNFSSRTGSVPEEGTSIASSKSGRNDYSMVQNQEELINKVMTSLGLLEGDDFVKYCSRKDGSTRIHGLLRLRNPEITCEIYNKVLTMSSRQIPIVFELMLDHYGWHVFAELIDSLNKQQLEEITYQITRDLQDFFVLTVHPHGSNSMKKVIRVLKRRSPLISFVTNKLTAAFLPIMTNQIGSYVVSECLNHLSSEDSKLLYDAAIAYCLELATDHEGSKALIRVINTIQGWQRYQLLDILSTHAVFLSQDPEGNYVIQKVISLNNPVFTEKLCHQLRGYYVTISMQKGGSHIVEKCLDTEWKSLVIEDFLSNTNALWHVAKDEFGNYVIQKALKVTKQSGSPLYQKLLSCLRPHLGNLQSGYGRNVFNLITGGQSVKKVQ